MKNMVQYLKNNIKWIACLISLALLIVLIWCLHQENINAFDSFYYHHIAKLISPKMTFFVKIVTNLGGALVLIATTIAILLFFHKKKYGILIMINLITVFLLNLLLKFIFARPRPLDINIITESGYSFPSAHAMVATAFYGFIIYLLWHDHKINKKRKYLYTILLCIIIFCICVTRIYLGVHFASDVVGGIFFSIIYLIIFTSILERNKIK